MPDGTALLDDVGVIIQANGVLSKMTGYSREELIGQNVQMLIPPRYKSMQSKARRELARDPETPIIWSDRELAALRKGGDELSVDFTLSMLHFDHNRWAIAQIRDNSFEREAERARAEAERNFRLSFEDNMAPMVFADVENRITDANEAFCEMVGRTRFEIVGQTSDLFTYPEDLGISDEFHERLLHGELNQLRYVKRFIHTDGHLIIAEVSKSPARDENDKVLYFIVSARDVTEERNLTAQLSHQALHDPLTGLANRALFEDRLAQMSSRIGRSGGYCALLLLDLDDFKWVNDTLGHLAGDQLLTEVAHRLQSVTRASDTLCRFGGDEFLYLADNIADPIEAERIAERLLSTFATPVTVTGQDLEQHASLGYVVWNGATAPGDDPVRNADIALYEAKRAGKGRFATYADGMSVPTANRFTLLQELRAALPTQQISMHYQPIVEIETGVVVGFESLMRWRHPERGWVPPNVFIPLAEQSELILDLRSLALHHAISAASTWVSVDGSLPPFVTVNLSQHQFYDRRLLPLLETELAQCGLAPQRLIIEVSESAALLEVADTLSVCAQLNRLGVGVALDDFGTGFSSLTYLANLAPIIIKIDQSFVRPARENCQNDRLLETIVALGHNLGMILLAEGIETTSQLQRLRHLDCTLGQGFVYSPAVPLDEVGAFVGMTFER